MSPSSQPPVRSRSASTRPASTQSVRARPAVAADNRVHLRGRLAALPAVRTLPSGDVLCSFRLTVDRPAGERGRVDSIDCAAIGARVRRTLDRAAPDDVLEVDGSLRRRFWRGPAGLSSRYEVLADSARISARARPARPRSGASPARTPASA